MSKLEVKREQCQLKILKVSYPELYNESLAFSNKEDYIMTKLGAKKVYRSGNILWKYGGGCICGKQ